MTPGLASAAALLLALGPAPPARGGSFDDCAARVEREPEGIDAFDCYHDVAVRERRSAEAIGLLEAILARHPDRHVGRLTLANLLSLEGEPRAEAEYRRAAAGLRAAGLVKAAVFAHLNLANLLSRYGRGAESIPELEAAEALAEASGDAELLARPRIQRAYELHVSGNDSRRAYRLARDVEAQVFPAGHYELRAACLYTLARITEDLGRNAEALGYLHRLVAATKEADDAFRGSTALVDELAFRLRRPELAGAAGPPRADEAREAVAMGVRGSNLQSEADAHCLLGHLLQGAESRKHYDSCAAMLRVRDVKALSAAQSARALRGIRSDTAASQAADEALALARRSADAWGIARAHHARAALHWEAGARPEARTEALAALDAVEAIRDRQPEELSRARTFSEWTYAYYDLASRLLEAGREEDVEAAFRVVERMRGRVLLEALDSAQATASLTHRGPLQEKRAGALRAMVELQRRLLEARLPDAERRDLLRSLEGLEAEEAELRERLAREDPRFAALRAPAIPSLAELRHALAADEAILSYAVATQDWLPGTYRSRSWLLVATRQGVDVTTLPDLASAGSRVEMFVGLIARRDGAEKRAAVRLHQDLLGRALDRLPARIQHLVVLPDGSLNRLPFAALRATEGAAPLGARYRISVAPSATLWLRWRSRRPGPSAASVLAFADPDLPVHADGAPGDRAWVLATGAPLTRLPHARAEARFVADLLRGERRVGSEATERFVKTTPLGRFGLLHVAAHALVDDEQPERSAIVLAPGSPEEDGLLQFREIVTLPLADRVVVLAACQSASGAVVAGEGVMGLARAFFQAGARTVVASLWPQRDDEAETLMRGLYGHLAEGESVAAALSAAQRDRISAGAPAAAWAGLLALGDGDVAPVPVPPTSRPAAGARLGAALLAALAALLGRRLLRRRRAPA